jgi:hypothetical protein
MKQSFWKKNDRDKGKNGEKTPKTLLQNLRMAVIMTP